MPAPIPQSKVLYIGPLHNGNMSLTDSVRSPIDEYFRILDKPALSYGQYSRILDKPALSYGRVFSHP